LADTEVARKFVLLFSLVYLYYVLILTKNGLGENLGEIFTNSSDHTGLFTHAQMF
jgi:hypothetical protein